MNIFLIAALSADGFIAPPSSSSPTPSTTWTSQEDKEFFIQKTTTSGVIIVGSNTYRTFGKPLKNRLNIVYTRSSIDSDDTLPKASLSSRTDLVSVKDRTDSGSHPTQNFTTNLPPNDLIKILVKTGYQSAAIIGGASIYTMFIKAQLASTIYLTIEPILFGQSINLFNDQITTNLNLKKVHHLSPQTIVLEYNVTY